MMAELSGGGIDVDLLLLRYTMFLCKTQRWAGSIFDAEWQRYVDLMDVVKDVHRLNRGTQSFKNHKTSRPLDRMR